MKFKSNTLSLKSFFPKYTPAHNATSSSFDSFEPKLVRVYDIYIKTKLGLVEYFIFPNLNSKIKKDDLTYQSLGNIPGRTLMVVYVKKELNA